MRTPGKKETGLLENYQGMGHGEVDFWQKTLQAGRSHYQVAEGDRITKQQGGEALFSLLINRI